MAVLTFNKLPGFSESMVLNKEHIEEYNFPDESTICIIGNSDSIMNDAELMAVLKIQ